MAYLLHFHTYIVDSRSADHTCKINSKSLLKEYMQLITPDLIYHKRKLKIMKTRPFLTLFLTYAQGQYITLKPFNAFHINFIFLKLSLTHFLYNSYYKNF